MTLSNPNDPESTVPVAEQHDRGPVDSEHGNGAFPIVGIGASAGGLEAYQQLLTHLPDDTGMGFVVIQHLDPNHESRMVDLLARYTHMPVSEATQGVKVEPNHVYMIPPNVNLAIVEGKLQITPRAKGRGLHLPIDYFFRALAEDQKTHAVGVILSGTGSDGAQGICEIKAMGGITLAQDEHSAKYAGMPHSAVESGCADLILPPEEIARRLARIRTHPYLNLISQPPALINDDVETQYRKVLTRVRAITGVDFTMYRDTTIKRRILRRMALHTQETMADYIRRLEHDPQEVRALYHDLLINVTSFFRDPVLFDALKQQVYPQIVRDKEPLSTVRVWVPGCSTGQEAYSIAMSLIEFFDDKPHRAPIQIFATDISDPTYLDKARAGIYPDNIEAELSPERLKRFFQKEDHTYRIDKSIRDLCVFARQNLTADPPFSHVDMVSCRNVLIYLAPPLQKRVLPTFHYALNSPGYLVLGSSESIGDNVELFEITDRVNKIYAKKPAVNRPLIHFAPEDHRSTSHLIEKRGATLGSTPADFQREADRLLLGRYAPPGVLVNENLDIVQFRGRTSNYLEPPPGEPTTNLLKMAREGLFLELRSAIEEVRKQHRAVRRAGVCVRVDGDSRSVNLEVVPVRPPASHDICFLIMFDETPAPERAGDTNGEAPGRRSEAEEEREVVQLRRELTAIKEYLQSLLEQQDAANEELRSANEEVLSSNEELQSTNEELETAKEELQSTNEELTTVNEQLQTRNSDLNLLNNDLSNLLASMAIPVVMVGPDLRIRRYTDAARRVFNLRANDIGRPLTDLQRNIEITDLDGLIHEVIDQVQLREREVRDFDGRWHRLRIHPYRTADHKIDGAVILLVDIDDIKRSAEAIRESEERFRLLADTAPVLIWLNGADGYEFVNKAYMEFVGAGSEAELHGDIWSRYLHPEDHEDYVKTYSAAVAQRVPFEAYFRMRRSDGAYRWMKSLGVPRLSADGRFLGYVGSSIDITDVKSAEQALREKDERLRLALEGGSLATWYCDLKADQCHWDERIHALLGALPQPVGNEGFFSAIHPDDREKLSAARHQALATGGFTEELRFLRADGSICWLLTTAKIFPDGAGAPAYLTGVCFDITAQKQTAAALQDRIEELKEADRQKNEFVALLAHELRNPLAPISNAVEILRMGTADAGLQNTSLNIIGREVQQMARMLEDLLDVSRLTRHRLDLRKQPLKLATIMQEAIEASQPYLDEKNHQLDVDLAGDDLWVEADRVRLSQVFSNLLINAAKYTNQGGDIRITTQREKDHVCVSVSDNGIGMSRGLLRRVFEMFSQGERATDSGGLGIGLTLVKSLVELHGGTVQAHSEGVNRGSVFSVRLPLMAQPEEEEEEEEEEEAKVKPQGRKKLLVVDDNKTQATSLCLLLEFSGHEVKTAHDGQSALALLADFVPDYALIDIGLPRGMSGYDVARRIREQPRFDRTVLIAQTGWGREEDREQSSAAGFDYHLVKPIDHDRLHRIIDGKETK
jgi:two-component system, chemotaxis family, CheB/CheR fusion protein